MKPLVLVNIPEINKLMIRITIWPDNNKYTFFLYTINFIYKYLFAVILIYVIVFIHRYQFSQSVYSQTFFFKFLLVCTFLYWLCIRKLVFIYVLGTRKTESICLLHQTKSNFFLIKIVVALFEFAKLLTYSLTYIF